MVKEIKQRDVLALVRISTSEDKQNIKQQENHLRGYADKERLRIVKLIKWIGTGKLEDGIYIKKLRKFLVKNPMPLLVPDSDRITRNFYEGVSLERFFIENNIEIISASENIDLTTPNGRFMFRIKLAMNSFYVENLLSKIKIGVDRAKREGLFKGRLKGSKNRQVSKSKPTKEVNPNNN